MQELDILVLGAGWTATFLLPLLRERQFNFAATTRDGREVAGEETIQWTFDASEDSDKDSQFDDLPPAQYVLITFPLTGPGQSKTIVYGYQKAHRKRLDSVKFIQLGSTGIWQVPQKTIWVTRRSPYDTSNARAIAEDELLVFGGCVLNLAGLWGGNRDARHWVDKIVETKEEVKGRKSLHMIHGLDVARAIAAVLCNWPSAKGQRWMLTDGFVYDWWSLLAGWADYRQDESSEDASLKPSEGPSVDREPRKQAQWVYELMEEEGVMALPRPMETLGRCYYGREFWATFQLTPLKGKIP